MKYEYTHDDSGKILCVSASQTGGFLGPSASESNFAFNPGDFYFDTITCELIQKPPAPSRHHVFDYAIKQWIDPRTIETEWPLVRAERDSRLLACDWTALPDVPLSEERRQQWQAYRQALRDVTDQPDPFNIVWPAPPA